MTFRRVGSSYILRIARGEELVETLSGFVQKYGITAGTVSAIGAADDITIGYFDEEKKQYAEKRLQGGHEILGLSGNVAIMESEPVLHLHIILGDRDYNVTGGHLISAKISVTCEVFLTAMDTIIHREPDKDSGLKLMKL